MKKTIILSCVSVLLVLICGGAAIQTETCDSKEIKNKLKGSLDPFKYDQSKITKINCKKKPSVKELEVPLFIGEKYRAIFNLEKTTVPLVISIYNKSSDSKNRKLLFSTKDFPKDKKEIVFEPEKRARTMYITYEVPAGEATSISCVGFMLGYK